MNQKRSLFFSALTIFILNGASCAEWQTTPVTVDRNRGVAVSTMIENQTMYPEHTHQDRQVMAIDGPKGEGIMESYRKPATDLRKGKEGYNLKLQGASGGMTAQ
jgi:hypothetical protein